MCSSDLDDKKAAFDLDMKEVDQMIKDFCKANEIENLFGTECTLDLNTLLDKVGRVGENGLTKAEFSRLKYLSNQI